MKLKKLFTVLVVLTLLMIAVGCTKQVTAPAPSPQPVAAPEAAPAPEPAPVQETKEVKPVEVKEPEAPKSGDIVLTDTGFEPAELTVSVGAKVVWENKAKVSLLVQEKSRLFVSKKIVTGDKYDFTFTKAGTYEYTNILKASQKGKVVVK